MQLTDEQEAAVAAMLSERTIVLTGGPGTGKTSVVVSLLRALARRAHAEGGLERVADEIRRVALAAPTGKAADRLGDAVRSALSRSADPIDATVQGCLTSPSTLHRLLGYRRGLGRSGSGGFRANRHNPLAQRLVLVDEVSMIDSSLFAHLLEAVAPDATLVLLGDPDQLPSVDPGAVLRDLVRARPAGVSVQALSKSHRMDPNDPDGAHVLSVARACLGAAVAVDVPFRALERARVPGSADTPSGGSVVGRGGAWHLEAAELPRVLDAWIARHLLVDALGALEGVDSSGLDTSGAEAPAVVREALVQLSRARILTVTRRTAEDLDAYVSAAVARWRGEISRARRVLPGEPVLAVHNDYDEDLWNGDSGVAWRDARGALARGHGAQGAGQRARRDPLRAPARRHAALQPGDRLHRHHTRATQRAGGRSGRAPRRGARSVEHAGDRPRRGHRARGARHAERFAPRVSLSVARRLAERCAPRVSLSVARRLAERLAPRVSLRASRRLAERLAPRVSLRASRPHDGPAALRARYPRGR
jgi:exodeoxyribonuclease V alpha subunit